VKAALFAERGAGCSIPSRQIEWQTLCTQPSNDNPLHVAVRAMRVSDMVWMVEYGGFSASLVAKKCAPRPYHARSRH